jgi:nickel/cobalt transporter (NicO) family protein
MLQIILSSFALSVIHGSIPNHWLPLIAVGHAQRWKTKKVLSGMLIIGSAHVLSTILIGILIGWFGYRITEHYGWVTRIVAPLVLILLGLIYLIIHFLGKNQHHHSHTGNISSKNSDNSILLSLAIAMFFSPCIELEAYYFTASASGWPAIALVSAIYFIVTVSTMMTLVYFSWKGIQRLNMHWLEHNNKLIIGMVLILIGITGFFIEF